MDETGTNMNKFVGAVVGFLGGGIASLITVGLIMSVFEMKYQSVLPAVLFGAFIGGLTLDGNSTAKMMLPNKSRM